MYIATVESQAPHPSEIINLHCMWHPRRTHKNKEKKKEHKTRKEKKRKRGRSTATQDKQTDQQLHKQDSLYTQDKQTDQQLHKQDSLSLSLSLSTHKTNRLINSYTTLSLHTR